MTLRDVHVVGAYPRLFVHRRNQDYLYHHALRRLYERLGHTFEIIHDPLYCLRAIHAYLLARSHRANGDRKAAESIARAFERKPLPARHARDADLVHSGGAIPCNCVGKVIREGEFYCFDPTDADPLPDESLDVVKALVVRTELSAGFFRARHDEKFHAKLHVVPFYMPYLERWESRVPSKPDPARGLNFIFVGNQARRKGLDLFLGLRDEMRRQPGANAQFTIVSNFQDGIDFDLTGCEVHRGVGGEQVQALMEQAHYLMLPTRSDSHPKVMYEACATGCTLIYSDIRPLRDIWNGSGHEVRLRDSVDSLRQLAAKLGERRGDLETGGQNRARFLAEFAPSVALRKYGALVG